MPIYEYHCDNCNKVFARFLPLARYQDPQYCCRLGYAATKLISKPMVMGDLAAYDCPITGKRIDGRKAHEENLKRTGCRVLEPGESQAVRNRKKATEASFEAAVDASVEEAIAAMPAEKLEALACELDNGADVAVTRAGQP